MAAPAVVDMAFWPSMLTLRECLEESLLESSPDAALCMVAVIPGDAPDLSVVTGGKGLAYVRFGGAQRTTGGMLPSVEYSPCLDGQMASVEIATWRCAPVAGTNGRPVTQEAWLAATEQQMADHAAMRRALCCFTDRAQANDMDVQVLFSGSSAVGPQGGATGVVMQFMLSEAQHG